MTGQKKAQLGEWAKSIFWAVILAGFLRAFVVQAFEIPSGSMENTLEVGDRLLVNKFLYGVGTPFSDDKVLKIRNPKRGDVIVFEYPADHDRDFIKRIVGEPGDRIAIVNKQVYVNDVHYADTHEEHREARIIPAQESRRDNMPEVIVPAGSYFVMGDNRDNSYDSRFWGFVRGEEIKGLAFVKYWSWDRSTLSVRWSSLGQMIQ